MTLLLYLFLQSQYPFEPSSVDQRSTSEALFGIYPAPAVDMIWNPAFISNKLQFEFLKNESRYNPFFRTALPLIRNNRFHLVNVLSTEEKGYVSGKGEMFASYNILKNLTLGASFALQRIIFTEDSIDHRTFFKMGIASTNNSGVSFGTYRESDSSDFTYFIHCRGEFKNWGTAISLHPENSKLDFIGIYHRTFINKVEIINLVRAEPKSQDKLEYLIPFILKFPISSYFSVQGGYNTQLKHDGEKLVPNVSHELGFSYNMSKLKVIINLGEDPGNTEYWEVGISYGN